MSGALLVRSIIFPNPLGDFKLKVGQRVLMDASNAYVRIIRFGYRNDQYRRRGLHSEP